MKITVIGTGYVGLVTAVCLSDVGNIVTGVDIDIKKIDKLKAGVVPIYEPNLKQLLDKNYKAGRLYFSTDIESELTKKPDVIFIAVGTPPQEDGSADLKHVLRVARDIGRYMQTSLVIVNKSTVPVGTADKVKATVIEELLLRKEHGNITGDQYMELLKFSVVSNPEFLKEGAAVNDFMKPDRVVIGYKEVESLELMKDLYHPFTLNHDKIIGMDIRSAELTKYAANAMLATKISFMNELARIAEAVGADINHVRHGIGSDTRIGYQFIYPGIGYGGSCFPKDVSALEKTAKEYGVNTKLLNVVQQINMEQRVFFVNKISNVFDGDLKGKVFAVWGLSFKPETDDMREAPAITVINELTRRGVMIKAYDPKAMELARTFWLKDVKNIEYCRNKESAVKDADALILITEWKEFRSPDFDYIGKMLKSKIIFDGRNQYDKNKLKELGFAYYQVGVR